MPPAPEVPVARLPRRLVALSRPRKLAVAMVADSAALGAALALVLVPAGFGGWPIVALLAGGVGAGLLSMSVFGCYQTVVRFAGVDFLVRLAGAMALAVALLKGIELALPGPRLDWPNGLLFGVLSFGAVAVLRLIGRWYLRPATPRAPRIPVLIYGAGAAGQQLGSALESGGHCRVAGFIDDAAELQGRIVGGLPVYAPADLAELRRKHVFGKILLALPSISRRRLREILETLEPLAVKVMVMPSLEDLAAGGKKADDLREVQIEDLLGREPVQPIESLLDAYIRGRNVMVTGAGGSIGAELTRIAVERGARKVVLFEISELGLYNVERQVAPRAAQCAIVPVLGDVTDRCRLGSVMREHRIETVYHAAAYKHVPMVESNVVAAVRNNVLGTLTAIDVALEYGVTNFVLVSTDKAVRPTSVMGATKRVCELVVQAFAVLYPRARLSIVRFGNVLASSGSIVPLFLEQIRHGGPVTVTHPEVTRYFMTVTEAAELVIQAGAMGSRGEVFVLDMGEPVRIRDLAERMIRLSGLGVRSRQNPSGDIAIHYTGLRPGEKLYEELLIGHDAQRTSHPRVFQAHEAHIPWGSLGGSLAALKQAIERDDRAQVVGLLKGLVPEFCSTAAVGESLPAPLPSVRGTGDRTHGLRVGAEL